MVNMSESYCVVLLSTVLAKPVYTLFFDMTDPTYLTLHLSKIIKRAREEENYGVK